MKSLLKFLVSVIGLLFILSIALVLLLVTFVNPNKFKDQISNQVTRYTGRQLTLNGDLHWSFYPWVGLQVNDASLSNAPGFGTQPFAQVNSAKVQVKLMPLLEHKIAVDSLTLDGLTIHLIKNANGKTNWQDLTKVAVNSPGYQVASISSDLPVAAPHNYTHDNKQFLFFGIDAIDIANSQITWDDQQQQQKVVLNQLEIHSKHIVPKQTFPLNIQFVLQSNQPELNGTITSKNQVIADFTQGIYQLLQFQLTSQLTGTSLPNNRLDLNIAGNLTFNSKQKSLQAHLQTDQLQLGKFVASNVAFDVTSKNSIINFNPITAQLYQGNYTGQIKLNTQAKPLQFTSVTNLTDIQVGPLLQDLGKVTKLQLTGAGNITANLNSKGSTSTEILKNLMGQGHFSLNNGSLHGINIPYWINTGLSLLHKESLPELPGETKTDFGNLTGTFTITNGVFSNNDLILKSSQLYATGAGTADLVKQQINYQFSAQMVNSDNLQPTGMVIPLQISGSFSHPTIGPAINSVVKTQLKDQYEKHKEAIGQQLQKFLGKDTGEKVKNQLENIFH